MENLIKRPSAVNGLDRINTTISPFAFRPGERIVHCDYPEKAKYISQYNITETEKLVLASVAEMLFCTSKLIMAKLDTMNTDVEPKTVRNAIDKLFDGGYLHKIYFSDGGSRSSYRVYFLSYKKGGYLYKSIFGCYPKRISYAESISDPSIIKKYLAINQYITNILAAPLLGRGQVINKKSLLSISSTPVRILGSVKLNDRKLVFFEAFRRSDTPEITLEKQSRLAKLLRSPFKNVTPEIEGDSVALVAICEDAEHAEEMRKFLCKTTYRGVNVTFTYDTAIFDSSDCVELEQAS